MNNTQPTKPFIKKSDIFIIALLLIIALGLFAYFRFGKNPDSQPLTAVVTVGYANDQTTLIIPLEKDGITTIQDGRLPVQLEVKDGAIRFINSVCPDHKCEGFGWLKAEGDWGACLPAAVTVTIAPKT